MGLDADGVIAAAREQAGGACANCPEHLVGHDVVLSLLMGFKTSPMCTGCLAAGSGDQPEAHLRRAFESIRRLHCYRAGWRAATEWLRAEGRWPHPRIPEMFVIDDEDADEPSDDATIVPGDGDLPPQAGAEFDAGDRSCGDLVLELRVRLGAMRAGDVLLVTALDPGARGDLPAWCRVTGHRLVGERHPLYWIRRRADDHDPFDSRRPR